MARLQRYFGATPDYWLDNCTLREWTDVWSRELTETPPVDDFAVMYFKYEPPAELTGSSDVGEAEVEEWQCPYPDVTA